jgi:hypothetical protein
MRSIAQALFWELWERGRLQIPGFFLLGNVFPLLVFSALQREGLDPSEQACLIVYTAFLPIMMFQFGVGIMAAQGSLARLYTAPISTASLVAWHMFPGAALMALEVAVALEVQRQLFHRELVVVGPSLFAFAAWASAQTLISVPQRTVFRFLRSAIPCMLMFLWLQSRFGDWFSQPVHYWTEVRWTELLFMMAAVAVSFGLTCHAVARDRCGELSHSSRLYSLWNRILNFRNFRGTVVSPFRSPIEAQLWYEWRYRGLALPLGTLLTLSIAGCILLLRLLQTQDVTSKLPLLYEGLIFGGGLLALLAALTGMLAGSTATGVQIRHHNPALRDMTGSGNFDQMGHFPATRPLTDLTMAKCVLRNAAKSVISAWLIWLVALLLVVFAAAGTNSVIQHPFSPASCWHWYLPLTLVGTWVAMMITTLMTLTGRFVYLLSALVAAFMLLVSADVAAQMVLMEDSRNLLIRSLLVAADLLIVTGTMTAFFLAHRRQLLETNTLRHLLISAAGLLLVIWWLTPAGLPLLVYATLLALLAMALLPFAAAPLAVAWNRHR